MPSTIESRSTSADIQSSRDNRCIVCGDRLYPTESGLFDTRFGIDLVFGSGRCAGCGLEQISPVPEADQLKSLYESYYNFGGETRTLYTKLREQFFFSVFYRFWMSIDGDISFYSKKGKGRLLDVGCNEGRGLSFYEENGFVVEGLELNKVAAEAARSRGYSVREDLLENIEATEQFDVVVLSNVLEHVLNPATMLGDVRRVLRRGGQVWISCPNSQSWLRRIFGRFWINWHVPFHIVHFSPATLSGVLEQSGFGVMSSRQETPALWVAFSVVASLFGRRGRPTRTLRNPLVVAILILGIRAFLFPILWIGNLTGRGDCLVFTAEKIQ